MSSSPKPDRRLIPSVDALLNDAEFAPLLAEFGHLSVRDCIRRVLADLRGGAASGRSAAAIAQRVSSSLAEHMTPDLIPVFNLTGTVLHTNLGRAALPDVAIQAMVTAAGSVNLEYDLKTGARGQRDDHVAGWITHLTGAEAAIVVNNNAAAVMIALNTLAKDKDAIVSRGELIEIGGAFRMPDIMASAGCHLREVGTTNRTHGRDFEAAIGPKTGLILKVHTSNYQVQGFTKSVPEPELAAIAHQHDLPFVVDLGSGTLVDLDKFGLPHETTVMDALDQGADLVTFSGDKLLGGPQAGIIAGRADLIARIAANPMKRAMRLDKITLAALGAVLRLYANPEKLVERLPTLAFLGRKSQAIKAQAERLEPHVATALEGIAGVSVTPCRSQIGSGALPVDLLDSYALTLRPVKPTDRALRDLANSLRALPRPVIGRINKGAVLLDLRTLVDETAFKAQLSALSG